MFYSVLSAIRRCFSRSPTHRAVLNAAKTNEIGPRGGARYRCSSCGESFGQREVQVDHINQIVPPDSVGKELSWDTIINNIFCTEENLQLLCTSCHKIKSKEERSAKTKGQQEQSKDTKSKRRKGSKADDVIS